MDGIVPDNTDNVKRLLDSGWKPLFYKFPDVFIQILTG